MPCACWVLCGERAERGDGFVFGKDASPFATDDDGEQFRLYLNAVRTGDDGTVGGGDSVLGGTFDEFFAEGVHVEENT